MKTRHAMLTDRKAPPYGRQNVLMETLSEHAAKESKDERERERHENEISLVNAAGCGSVPPERNAFLTDNELKNETLYNQALLCSVSVLKGSLSSFTWFGT